MLFVRQDFALRDDERAGIIDVPQAISRHVAQSVAHFLRQKRPKTYEFLVLRMNGNESPRGRHFLPKLLITRLCYAGTALVMRGVGVSFMNIWAVPAITPMATPICQARS